MERLVKDAARLDKSVKANDLSFQNIVKAIHAVQENLEITGTTSKEAADTISGSAGSMKSAWDNLVTGMANKNADLGTLINQFVESVKTWARNIIPVFSQALTGVGQLIQSIAPMIVNELPGLLSELLPQLLKAAVTLINGVVAALPTILKSLIQAAKNIVPQIGDTIVSTLPQLIEVAIDLILTLADGIANNVDKIVSGIITLVSKIADTLTSGEALSKLAQAAVDIIVGLGNAISSNIDKILEVGGKIVNGLIEGAKKVFPQLYDAFIGVIDDIGAKLSEKFPALSGLFDNLSTVIGAVVGGLVAFKAAMAISSIISGVTKAVGAFNAVLMANPIMLVVTLIGVLVGAFVTLMATNEDFRNKVTEIWNNVKSTITNIFNNIKSTATSIWNGIKNTIINVWNSIKNSITSIVRNVQSLLSNAWNTIRNVASSAWGTIKNAIITPIKELPQKVIEIGANIVKGIWNGISSGAKWLWDKITGFAGDIISKVKGAFGIHSPSTVFAGIGKNLALGLGEGWEKEYKNISNDIEGSLKFNSPDFAIGDYGISNIGSAEDLGESSDTETVTEYNMQVTINLNGSDYTSQRQIAEEISVQLQNLVNRRSAAWA